MPRKTSVPFLSQNEIESKARELLDWVRPTIARVPSLTPVAEIAEKLVQECNVQVQRDFDLGYSKRGRKILGMCQFRPHIIYIDRHLDPFGPRYRFTLAHELGHLILHRKLWLDPAELEMPMNQIHDDRSHVFGARRPVKTARDRLEWQANAFAAALLMPRNTVIKAVFAIQARLGVRRGGRVYLDDQSTNIVDCMKLLYELADIYQVSRTALEFRLKDLRILHDHRNLQPSHISRLFRVA